jgi:hypothetical protein
MIGRRVATVDDLERAGDYCGPMPCFTCEGEPSACFFLLPNARDEGAEGPQCSVNHVHFPPHTFRECPDGSLEIRASIGGMPWWHGYLDEGHVWRQV